MYFEEKEASARIVADEVCLAGELNDEEVQKDLLEKGCLSLVDIVY